MDLEKFFQNQNKKKQVKILTCGSVDDGKSTLLGRLLYDSQNVFVDQMDQVKIESEKYGTQGKDIDLALLIDGLQAEREQGITIDVASVFLKHQNVNLLLPIRLDMNNIHAIWRQALLILMLLLS